MGRKPRAGDATAAAAGEGPQGLGFGLRLGNARAAFGSVIHADLAFPLDGDRSISKVQFVVEAKRTF